MSARLALALMALNERITRGQEFPTALWAVTQTHHVESDDLREAYDDQFHTR